MIRSMIVDDFVCIIVGVVVIVVVVVSVIIYSYRMSSY